MKQETWLVTGAAGFIGSHLVEHLLRHNQLVIGVDNLITGRMENLDDVRTKAGQFWSNFEFIQGDLRNLELCQDVCQRVDFILHQAALGSVPRSLNDPINTHEHNVNVTLNLLSSAKKGRCRRFVYASSSSVYGSHPELPKVEDQIGVPLSPYAASKRVCEIYASAFENSYGLSTVGLRYFNVFGPRQRPDGPYAAVIPRWTHALIQNKPITIYGDGQTSRDFCYVANVVEANMKAALSNHPDASNKVYNVAFGAQTSLLELFELIVQTLKEEHAAISPSKPQFSDFRSGDIRHSLANISLARKLIGYDPEFSIRDGLKASMKWYTTCDAARCS